MTSAAVVSAIILCVAALAGYVAGRSWRSEAPIALPARKPAPLTEKTQKTTVSPTPMPQYEAWEKLVRAAPVEELPALLAGVENEFPERPSSLRPAAAGFVFACWAQRDPEHLVRWIFEGDNHVHDSDAGWQLGRWNAAAAFAIIQKLQSERATLTDTYDDYIWPDLLDSFSQGWAVADPAALLQAATDDTDSWLSTGVSEALAKLAESSPEAARDHLQRFIESGQDEFATDAVAEVIRLWHSRSPRAAAGWIAKLEGDELRALAAHAWFLAEVKRSPTAALTELASGSKLASAVLESHSEEILIQAAGMDFRAAMECAVRLSGAADGAEEESQDPIQRGGKGTGISVGPGFGPGRKLTRAEISNRHLSQISKSLAAAFGASLHGPAEDQARQIVREIAALPAESNLAQGEMASAAFESSAWSWRPDEFAVGMRMAATAPEEWRGPALRAILNTAEEADSSAALNLLKGLPPEIIQHLGPGAATAVALNDASLPGRLLHSKGIVPPEYFRSVELSPPVEALAVQMGGYHLQQYAENCAGRDPAAAAAWAAALPDGHAADAAASVARIWVSVEQSRAGAWAVSLPAGPLRDAAAAGIAQGLATYDRPTAKIWLEQIADPVLKAAAEQRLPQDGRNPPAGETPSSPDQ